jgi:DsbC/DsbD-like thiol-disulfide interchange protein
MRAHRRTAGWTIAALIVGSSAALAAPPASRHVQAELVSEVESIRAGERFWVALHLKMDPEWHTYWKNPGDSGLPSRLTWKLPAGFTAGEIEWPYPKTFTQGPVTSYGYEGEVLLPVAITPPASLAAGSPVTLAARADWLECREACLPGRRELTLEVPVRSEPPKPSARWAAAFEDTRRRLPDPGTGWTFQVKDTPPRLVLVIQPPRAVGAIGKARFFPDKGQVIDHAAPQTLAPAAGGYRLEMTLAPNAPRPLGAVEGVLVTEGAGGTRAVRVEAHKAGARGLSTGGGAAPPSDKEDR